MLKKGDVVWAELPEGGIHVQKGRRPVLILGSDAACKYSPVLTVAPLSSKLQKADKVPTHVLLLNLKKKSIVLTEQVRTIPKECILSDTPIYQLNRTENQNVNVALASQLGLK